MKRLRGPVDIGSVAALSATVASLSVDSPFSFERHDGKLRIEGYATSGNLNRYGYRIKPSAWVGAFTRKNPILLFNHDDNRPIGKVTEYEVHDDKGLFVRAEVTDSDIAQKIDDGVLSEFSVRFRILSAHVVPHENKKILEVTKVDGYEVSVVSIPADPSAQFETVRALSAGFDQQVSGGPNMEFKEMVIRALGLASDASEATILLAIEGLKKPAVIGQKLGDVADILKLSADSSTEDIRRALADLRNPVGFVEKTQFDASENKVKELSVRLLLAENADKIPPGEQMKKFAQSMAEQGEEKFQAWLETVKDLPKPSTKSLGERASNPPYGTGHDIPQAEKQVLEMLGVFRDTFDANGVQTGSGVKLFTSLVDLSPSEALAFVFPNVSFSTTAYDEAALERRKQIESR